MSESEYFKIFTFFFDHLNPLLLLFKKIKKTFSLILQSKPEIQLNKNFQELKKDFAAKGVILKQLYSSYQILKVSMISQQDLWAKVNSLETICQKYGWQKEQEIINYFELLTRGLLKIQKELNSFYNFVALLPKPCSTVDRNISFQLLRFDPIR